MVESFVKVSGALATLITSSAWPLVAVWLIWKFAPVIRDFLANISEGSVKAFGVEATAKRNAAVEIVKADLKAELPSNGPSNFQLIQRAENSIRSADLLTSILPVKELRGKSVLWVDDEPEINSSERRALTELGLKLDIETDAEGAMNEIAHKRYDVIVIVPRNILDRPEGELLTKRLRASQTPYIIYGAQYFSDKENQKVDPGAYAVTSDVTNLFLSVTGAVRGMYSSDAMQDYVHYFTRLREATRPTE